MSQKINAFRNKGHNDTPKVPPHTKTPPPKNPAVPVGTPTNAPQFRNDDKTHTDSEFLRAHRNSDVDHDATSLHHKLGKAPTQAASGDHDHSMAGLPVGVVVLWSGPALPNNYFPCTGTAISRKGYSDYFALVGTNYGVGDGSTTFNLPTLIAPSGLTYGYYIVKVKSK